MWIIINSPDNMAAHIGAAATGASTGYADIIHIKVKQDHLRFLCFGKGHTQHGIQTLTFLVAVKNYDHADLKNLDFPENDVEELGRLLEKSGFKLVVLTTGRGRQDDQDKPTAANTRRRLIETLQ